MDLTAEAAAAVSAARAAEAEVKRLQQGSVEEYELAAQQVTTVRCHPVQ